MHTQPKTYSGGVTLGLKFRDLASLHNRHRDGSPSLGFGVILDPELAETEPNRRTGIM